MVWTIIILVLFALVVLLGVANLVLKHIKNKKEDKK